MDKITESIARELTVDMIPNGIWKAVALEIGPVNLIKLLDIINGDDMYVPKPDRFLAPARDKIIKREFNGYNHDSLARKYGLTTGYVRRLCGAGQVLEQCSLYDVFENVNTGNKTGF